jgi:thioredoxin 1
MNYIKIICLFLLFGCSAEQLKTTELATANSNRTTNDYKKATAPLGDHNGEIESVDLLNKYPAFQKQYQRYQIKTTDINLLKDISHSLHIVVIFGTWCHDSKREVSRFIKLIEAADNTLITTQFWAVDRNKNDAVGFAKKFNLQKTPTFIIQNSGDELGRIIERPHNSLAVDIINLLKSSDSSY